jgi:hypothetical protein
LAAVLPAEFEQPQNINRKIEQVRTPLRFSNPIRELQDEAGVTRNPFNPPVRNCGSSQMLWL